MNLVLLDPEETLAGGRIVLRGRRAEHILAVLKARPGDVVKVGVVGGRIGTAEIVAAGEGEVTVAQPVLDAEPPHPWFDIMLAMPRPKVMHRMWPTLAAMGAREIIVVNAAKVEKCYFDSHWLAAEVWTPLLREGLEQACATCMPQVSVRRRLKPFVEDEIPRRFAAAPKLVAHPYCNATLDCRFTDDPALGAELPLVAIGPEGGWTEFELGMLAKAGFRPFSVGRRILRTDVAAAAILGSMAKRG